MISGLNPFAYVLRAHKHYYLESSSRLPARSSSVVIIILAALTSLTQFTLTFSHLRPAATPHRRRRPRRRGGVRMGFLPSLSSHAVFLLPSLFPIIHLDLGCLALAYLQLHPTSPQRNTPFTPFRAPSTRRLESTAGNDLALQSSKMGARRQWTRRTGGSFASGQLGQELRTRQGNTAGAGRACLSNNTMSDSFEELVTTDG